MSKLLKLLIITKDHCGPCEQLKHCMPSIERVIKINNDITLEYEYIEYDSARGELLRKEYKINAAPTTIVVGNISGKEYGRVVGFISILQIVKELVSIHNSKYERTKSRV